MGRKTVLTGVNFRYDQVYRFAVFGGKYVCAECCFEIEQAFQGGAGIPHHRIQVGNLADTLLPLSKIACDSALTLLG